MWDIQANWSPTIEKQIIAELKEPVAEKGKKNKPKSTVQALCLFVAGIGLLSLGLCMQANAMFPRGTATRSRKLCEKQPEFQYNKQFQV
ncbi:MAG: hypothetical protein KME60_23470 [Cyanomargarita calcarea GSE-NOS-MK-12-04C]|uniref:Uncharacterized protein n=1 Tax=Cyanomargarita calcarea GSE-NOS-MK-12-04C TaxID=2839659 RepID=A0A951UWZ4_9CYAN|nr:hypothetical protein [Cyanomargarita calcarea GSE-NOS-MK-12-04C]